ncbi:hypothetical protein QBC46DRAFT_306881 [Diplogelasinospora grovesii]|uniref:Uncharacterized protein n=1 Tax=Diplogelasinospora grovesii TaxID=303347 RepID=A0AAN6NGH8_9PEZI|nr:hypothetical protein QBC46DRAFT_306881 [Diplogelasinospora grovesii]
MPPTTATLPSHDEDPPILERRRLSSPSTAGSPSSRRARAVHNADSFTRNQEHETNGLFRTPGSPLRTARLQMTRITRSSSTTQPQEQQQPISTINIDRQKREWKPDVAIGSPLKLHGEDLSRIELADRKIAQRKLWVEFYGEIADFPEMLEEALRERQLLDERSEENTLPLSMLPSTNTSAVTERLDLLRSLLTSSEFPPERANIEAAIRGYESGTIPGTSPSYYTLIYAGQVVDTCPDYASFTDDRAARLDRYCSQHGPGWLWYEPPLVGPSSSSGSSNTILAKKGVCLQNRPNWRRSTENMGHYRIKLGFQRRKELVSRQQQQQQHPFPTTTTITITIRTMMMMMMGRSEPDPDGPRIIWDTLLDCGATLPCIYQADLPKLRIDPKKYAAQGARIIATAESTIKMKTYEMDVCVYGSSPSDNPPPELEMLVGMTVPVVVMAGRAGSDYDGDLAPDRLSGLLPFHLCYWSSAPGRFEMWMGEERRDVLGVGRFPGAARYRGSWKDHHQQNENRSSCEKRENKGYNKEGENNMDNNKWMDLGTPKRITFEHDLVDGSTGLVVQVIKDMEGEEGGSTVVTGPDKHKSTQTEEEEDDGVLTAKRGLSVQDRIDVEKLKLRKHIEKHRPRGGGERGGERKRKSVDS